MEKIDEVNTLLSKIAEQVAELLENETLSDLTAEEMVVLAVELVTSIPVTQVTTGQPVGVVDRENALFLIDDDTPVPLFGDTKYYEDPD